MDRLKTIETFIATAKAGSFSAAARDLRQSRGLVSRQIADLEKHLGVRLFTRTTRDVNITFAGRHYLDFCARAVQNLQEAELDLANLQRELRGTLRIISVRSFGVRHVAAAVADFARLNPQLSIELELAPGVRTGLQLARSSFDIGIAIAPARGAASAPKLIAEFDWVICAGRDYVKQHGAPKRPHDLRSHTTMINPRHTPSGVWEFRLKGKPQRVRVDPAIAMTNFWALREATLADAGVALLPSFCIMDDLSAGTIVRLLPEMGFERSAIRSHYPHDRNIPHKVRAFSEFLQKRFEGRLVLPRA